MGGKPGDQSILTGVSKGGSQSLGHGGSGGLDTRHTSNSIRFAASDGFELSPAVLILSVKMQTYQHGPCPCLHFCMKSVFAFLHNPTQASLVVPSMESSGQETRSQCFMWCWVGETLLVTQIMYELDNTSAMGRGWFLDKISSLRPLIAGGPPQRVTGPKQIRDLSVALINFHGGLGGMRKDHSSVTL